MRDAGRDARLLVPLPLPLLVLVLVLVLVLGSPKRELRECASRHLRPHAAVRLAGRCPRADNPALRAWRFHKKPPAGAGGLDVRDPAASCRSSLGGPPPACRQPGPPGLALPQKAPGGSRGTPGCMPSRVPCDVGLNRKLRAVIRHGRRGGFHTRCPRVSTRGFLERVSLPQKAPGGSRGGCCTRTCGLMPQFAWRASARMQTTRPSGPGASTKSPRREPGDTGWHAFPGAMRCGFEPVNCVPSSGMDGGMVFTPGAPGFPPGASCVGARPGGPG